MSSLLDFALLQLLCLLKLEQGRFEREENKIGLTSEKPAALQNNELCGFIASEV
jgi:hypothetical protein